MKTLDLAKENYQWMVDWRREFHKHPEPSFKEFRTTDKIEEELKKMGIETLRVTKTGVVGLLKGGVLENPKVDMIFGMHIWSDVPVGQVALQSGPVMASADCFDLTITGKSAHGSSPWQGVDALTCATAVVQGLHTIATKVNDARQPIVINVGTFHSGERFNVIPGKATLQGMNRAFTEHSRRMLPEWIEKMIKNTCEAYGCEYEYDYDFMCSPTINGEKSTKLAQESVGKVVGKENILTIDKVMGSEDFSEYLQRIPGAFMFLGGRNEEKGCKYSHHSNFFNVDEDALPIGAASYAQVAVDFLNENK